MQLNGGTGLGTGLVGTEGRTHEMTSGVIPLRDASLPGHVKLPRRYEKAAMGSKGIPVRVRKISLQPGGRALGDSLSARLDDLLAAVLWVRQELIMLRQHDILLKRQFFDIQHSILSLRQKPKPPPSSPSPSSSSTTATLTPPSSTTTLPPPDHHPPPTAPCPTILLNGSPVEDDDDGDDDEKASTARRTARTSTMCNGGEVISSSRNLLHVLNVSSDRERDFLSGPFVVRPSSSVTLLRGNSEDEEEGELGGGGGVYGMMRVGVVRGQGWEEGEEDGGYGEEERDVFCEDPSSSFLFFRPRTSSMRTSRDMAALARRRGSKELI
ncbi:uncharacterized protein LOC143280463 [Babylonia areolata]|uniref:uncharacterized protein LOC143280463 n=1 Tax=Babylonia areolata TaxID=304850 RepID=UPI003FD564AA